MTDDRHLHGRFVEGFSPRMSIRVLTALKDLDEAINGHVVAVLGEDADGREFVLPCPNCGAQQVRDLLLLDWTRTIRRMEEWLQ